MRVTVDQAQCVASGQCALAVGEVFDQREEDGIVVLRDERPPADLEDAIRDAADTCPVGAIRVAES